MEDNYENWFKGFLDDKKLKFLKKIIKVLGYTSLKEYYNEYMDAIEGNHQFSENYFSSKFYSREMSRLNPISLFNEFRYLLFLEPNKKRIYESIKGSMLKYILSQKYNTPEYSSLHLKMVIEVEKSYGKIIALRGYDHTPVIRHLELIKDQKKLQEFEQSLESTLINIKKPDIIEETKGKDESEEETLDECEYLEDDITENLIIPAPKIPLGILGNLLPLIAEDLQTLKFTNSTDEFLQLFDSSLLHLPTKIKWNGSIAELVFLFEELLDKKVISPVARDQLKNNLSSTIVYLKKGRYVPVTPKSFNNARNREIANPSSKKTSKKQYKKLVTILEARFIEKVDSNIG